MCIEFLYSVPPVFLAIYGKNLTLVKNMYHKDFDKL